MVDFIQIIFIAVIALLLFGPDKMPEYIRQIGKFYAEVKKAQREFEMEINKDSLISQSSIVPKMPSEKVIEIAKKMGISVEGKTEEQLLNEINRAVTTSREVKEN
ncbi:translocase [Methanocella sp. CWC-04]|uniref:Translocase n=1 Tax=Methanooceanicella nereidis TaxID=2052831 RepID=A0AAP2W452_9EURY|nr:twin-arginine translocase TatA/TatE family subunit [Methanocella sp. CWC-04]MCD1293850.1 translocase [Methanocella sp. CWC-04]